MIQDKILQTEQTNPVKEKLHMLLRLYNKDEKLLIKTSNEEWQEILSYIKSATVPSKDKRLIRCSGYGQVVRMYWSLTDNELRQESLDARYVNYINDVLKEVRENKKKKSHYTATVFHVYQVCQLLKFEPELKINLVDGFFEAWLEK